MIDFPKINEFGDSYQLKELSFRESAKIAEVDKKLSERRLTVMLQQVLESKQDPLMLTVQQRYFLLLDYLKRQEGTILDNTARKLIPNYIKKNDCSTWNTQITQGSISVKQMTGKEAEYLEIASNTIHQKIIGMIAMQYMDSNIEQLSYFANPTQDDKVWQKQIIDKCSYLAGLTALEFEEIYNNFSELNSQLNTHLNLSISLDGFCIYGGTDDAPMRFCAIDGVTRTIAELDG